MRISAWSSDVCASDLPLEISRIDAPQNLVAEPDFTAGHVAVRLEDGAQEGRFGYLVRDGLGGGATAQVTVARINQPPEAVRDYRSIEPDRPARIPGAELVANDVDVDGHTLRVTTVSDPLNGTVTLEGDTAIFTPESPFGTEGGDRKSTR